MNIEQMIRSGIEYYMPNSCTHTLEVVDQHDDEKVYCFVVDVECGVKTMHEATFKYEWNKPIKMEDIEKFCYNFVDEMFGNTKGGLNGTM